MGQTIARRFAAEGAKVVVAGRDEAELATLAAEIDGAGVACDITEEADLARLADDRGRSLRRARHRRQRHRLGPAQAVPRDHQGGDRADRRAPVHGPVPVLPGDAAADARRRIDHPDLVGDGHDHARGSRRLYGHQGRRRSCHPLRRQRVRPSRHPRQFDLAGLHDDADDREGARATRRSSPASSANIRSAASARWTTSPRRRCGSRRTNAS